MEGLGGLGNARAGECRESEDDLGAREPRGQSLGIACRLERLGELTEGHLKLGQPGPRQGVLRFQPHRGLHGIAGRLEAEAGLERIGESDAGGGRLGIELHGSRCMHQGLGPVVLSDRDHGKERPGFASLAVILQDPAGLGEAAAPQQLRGATDGLGHPGCRRGCEHGLVIDCPLNGLPLVYDGIANHDSQRAVCQPTAHGLDRLPADQRFLRLLERRLGARHRSELHHSFDNYDGSLVCTVHAQDELSPLHAGVHERRLEIERLRLLREEIDGSSDQPQKRTILAGSFKAQDGVLVDAQYRIGFA